MNDRRQVQRWQIRKEVKLAFEGVEGVSTCCVEDINLKGMCLSLEQRLPQDRDIKIALVMDDGLDINIEVRIPWVREQNGRYIHGMSFTRIRDNDRENIYQYVNSRFPDLFRQSWSAPAWVSMN